MNSFNKENNSIYPYDEWKIIEEEFRVENNLRNETIFSLGNGYIGMRGSFEEGGLEKKDIGHDGTYINGFYESEAIKYPETAYGYAAKSQTMLNVTNSKVIRLYVDGEEFNMLNGNISEYKRVLSLKDGILNRSLLWNTSTGKTVKIHIQRLVSFKNKHLAVINYQITPMNFSGKIKLVSALDGDITNLSAKDDPRVGSGLQGRTMKILEKSADDVGCYIVQETNNSKIATACFAKNHIVGSDNYTKSNISDNFLVGNIYDVDTVMGETVTLNKYISYVTSREFDTKNLSLEASKIAFDAYKKGYNYIKAEQMGYLQNFWQNSDIEIKGDISIQQGLRINMFHILQSVGRDGITNIGAKGLTGEGYEGHYFWDTEIYILPFFLYSEPKISRKLLEYRYSILDKARNRARELSHSKGALFPWRTIAGEECSTYYPAGTAQYHINADIAFAIKKYMDATCDYDFLIDFGAEILFETARIWVSLGFFNPRKENKFCINGVTGPDEYNVLVNNNCYTNLMARENLLYAYDVAMWMKEHSIKDYKRLILDIDLNVDEIPAWKKAADNMFIPYDNAKDIYLQDDEFLNRVPLDISQVKNPMLLHYHPLVIYRHMVCKQADFILALYLLGDNFTIQDKKINYDFYESVTTHDSSLSSAIFSIIAKEIGYYDKAYEYFLKTARLDLDDLHGNTKDGIHAANMAGAWMCVVNGFAGMRADNGRLSFSPYLPKDWDEYSFKMVYRGSRIKVIINKESTTYDLISGNSMVIIHNGKESNLSKTKIVMFNN